MTDETTSIDYSIHKIDTDKASIPQRACAKQGVLPKFPFSLLLSGHSGAGKSNLLLSILSRKELYGDYFHYIIVISPTAGDLDDSYKILKLPEENYVKTFERKFFDDLLETRKDLIKKKGIKWVAKNSRVLIVLDDCIAENKFLNSPEALKLFTLLRHYLCAVIMLTQSYMKCPRSLRINAMGTYIFPATQSEIERLVDECCPAMMRKRDFENVIDYCTSEQYNFMAINKHAKPDERIRKNLNEIVDLNKFKGTGSALRKASKPHKVLQNMEKETEEPENDTKVAGDAEPNKFEN